MPRLSHWLSVRHQSRYWLHLPSAFLLHPLLALSLVFEHAWCENSILIAFFLWNALRVLFPCFTLFSSLLECHCLCILPRPSLTSLHLCLPRPSLPWFFFMLSSYANFTPLSLFYDYLLKYRFCKGKNVNCCCCFSLLYLSCPMTMAYSRYSKSFNQIIVFQTIQGRHLVLSTERDYTKDFITTNI